MSDLAIALALGAACVLTLLLSAACTAAMLRIARRIGFVDRPGGHKSHRAPVPYGGGVAIFVGAWLPLALVLAVTPLLSPEWLAQTFDPRVAEYIGGVRIRWEQTLVLLAGGLVLHLLGLRDDVRPLGAWSKLAVIAAVGLLVAWQGNVRLVEFAGPGLAILLTTVWFIVLINAFNFLDNMDGLSAGVGFLCLAFLALCGRMAGQVHVPGLACVFMGAVGGFLLFNYPPARIFMGDAGSLLVGYMVACISVLTTYQPEGVAQAPAYPLAMPLVILAIPLYDFVSVVGIRVAEGRNPMRGDQRHFSHRLVQHGLSRKYAVLTIYLATATTGLAATLLPQADLRGTLTVLALVAMVLGIIAILESPPRSET